MKILTPILVSLLFAISINGQDLKKAKSKLDAFSSSSGKLIKKHFINIGEVSTLKVRVLVATDLITESSVSALRMEYSYKTSYSTKTAISHLDKDEVNGLKKAIDIVVAQIETESPVDGVELTYRSRTGFEAGAYVNSKKEWKAYIKVDKYDKDSYIFLKDVSKLKELKSIIEQAEGKMK